MKFYLILTVVAIVFCAYFTGRKIAQTECAAHVANANTDAIIKKVNIQRMTNEKVFHTGVRDIRNILRKNYTIAE